MKQKQKQKQNDLAITTGNSLEVPKKLRTMKKARKVADIILAVEGDVRLAKGQWWNACEDGTREALCNEYGWKYPTMRMYGQFAREVGTSSSTTPYGFWLVGYHSSVKPDKMKKLTETALSEGWTLKKFRSVTLDESVKQIHIDTEKQRKEEKREKKEDEQESKRQEEKFEKEHGEPMSNYDYVPPKLSESVHGSLECLGIEPLKMDTLKIIYKGLSKKLHPDMGGDEEQFKLMCDCYETLKEEIGGKK